METNPFYQSICDNECRNTHHKLVMNSLKHLNCEDADQWRGVFVKYFEYFLQGSKEPDTKFKDFRNHVLHVNDNFWGGPVGKAERWYDSTVKRMQEGDLKSAVYCAGVLSHYYMDPLMPLHTGQSEEEGVVHRACEWSINKSFSGLISELESGGGYPEVQLPDGQEWLKKIIHHNATIANGHYQTFIDHYDIKVGSRRPEEGLDSRLREISSALLGYASVSFARVLEKAIREAQAKPKAGSNWAMQYFYLLTRPVSWGMKWFRNWRGSSSVKKIATEYLKFGKVIDALPLDEQVTRALHAKEVLRIELEKLDEQEIRPVGTKSIAAAARVADKFPARQSDQENGTVPVSAEKSTSVEGHSTAGNKIVFRLDLSDPVVDAPSVGEKTAARLKAVGLKTVGQFLSVDPAKCTKALNLKYVTPDLVKQWQTQTKMACQIPCIYGHDAQILVACGFDTPDEVAAADPDTILSLVEEFKKTKEAKFIIRNSQPPDLDEVKNWIAWAKQSRSLTRKAA